MTATASIDDFLLRHAPREPAALPDALLRSRAAVSDALTDLRAVPDAALEKPWTWRGTELDVRYGLYRQFEALEGAKATVRRLLGDSADESPARALVGLATATRWDLHGVLAALDETDLDRDPGNGEWTIRRTLAHIVSGQRAYGWGTAWWYARRDAAPDDFPPRLPEEVIAQLPPEETEADGSLAAIGARLDDTVDLSSSVFAGLDDDGLAIRARWSGHPVDIRFRLLRWSSHIREHTVQVEKTLDYLGRPTTEVQRLLRLVGAAYGRLEEEVYMLPVTDGRAADALATIESVTAGVAEEARTVRAAA